MVVYAGPCAKNKEYEYGAVHVRKEYLYLSLHKYNEIKVAALRLSAVEKYKTIQI